MTSVVRFRAALFRAVCTSRSLAASSALVASSSSSCLLYTSDAADEGLGVGLVGRCIIKKKDAWYCESIVSD